LRAADSASGGCDAAGVSAPLDALGPTQLELARESSRCERSAVPSGSGVVFLAIRVGCDARAAPGTRRVRSVGARPDTERTSGSTRSAPKGCGMGTSVGPALEASVSSSQVSRCSRCDREAGRDELELNAPTRTKSPCAIPALARLARDRLASERSGGRRLSIIDLRRGR
jgi:hypothetical protein